MKKRAQLKVFQGFTLVELAITVTITALLLGIAIPNYNLSIRNAAEKKVLADLQTIDASLQIYKARNGVYPRTGLGPTQLVDIDWINTTLNLSISNSKYTIRYNETNFPNTYLINAIENYPAYPARFMIKCTDIAHCPYG